MKRKQLGIVLLLIAMVVAAGAAVRVSASYQVSSDVVASGGEAGDSLSYDAPVNIVGQGVIGASTSGSYQNEAGFALTLEFGEPEIHTSVKKLWKDYK